MTKRAMAAVRLTPYPHTRPVHVPVARPHQRLSIRGGPRATAYQGEESQVSNHGSSDLGVANESESLGPAESGGSDTSQRAILPVGSIVAGETPRLSGVNHEHVHVLAKVEDDLPPILVERETLRVIDGMHRLRAAIARGQEMIEVELFEGPERAAFVKSVEANIAHGLPLSLADRRAAAERMIELYPEWSDRKVAASAGLSDKTVAAVRRSSTADGPQLSARIGRDGRTRPLDGTVGRWIASELIDERPQASLREIANEAGISVATVRDVRERMRRGEDPIPVRRTASVERHDGNGSGQVQLRTAPNGSSMKPVSRRDPAAAESDVGLDCGPLLEGLKRDPSLRYNDAGRALLRWLDYRAVSSKELEIVTARIPPHAAIIVARVARSCSAIWEHLASELEIRAHDST